jgi:hypothetical protein
MRGPALAVATVLAALLAACGRPAPASCADPLGGAWRVAGAGRAAPSGEARRYHALDQGAEIDLYPMFDDSVTAPGAAKPTGPGALDVAPAAFHLTRTGDGAALVGSWARRFERGGRVCILRTPARLTGCAGGRATLEATPVAPPADWAACRPGPPPPSVRWTLIRD